MMLYIHVPFCRHKCSYCDFMSGTNIGLRRRYINHLRSGKIDPPTTLYFGGGTPSILTPDEIAEIYDIVGSPSVEEWTVECNPEDMTFEWLSALHDIGVSRLSVGVQSLNDDELRWMERRHSASDSLRALTDARRAGFSNISADIIFGIPGQSLHSLKSTINGISSLGLQHISAYSLMFEQGSKITMKNLTPIDEDLAADMYRMICDMLLAAGYDHYEISNWALPGFRSRHNSGYWTGEPYIGLGPAAHSFDGIATRTANVPNTLKWLRGDAPEVEHLTLQDRFNERVMLSLRTVEGINLSAFRRDFPEEWVTQLLRDLSKYSSLLTPSTFDLSQNRISLFPNGVYLSDLIMQSCMRVN